jgi:hypothetical protein
MISRPTSVTVIAWILIAMNGLGLFGFVAAMQRDDKVTNEIMAKSPVPIPVQHAIGIAGMAVGLVSGYFLLKRKNWARYLYVCWTTFGLLFALATSPMKLMLIPSALIFVVTAFFLFRPDANKYFTSDSASIDPRSIPSMREVIGVIFYILAGFFFSCTGFTALMSPGAGVAKMMMICFVLLPFSICLAIGRWLSSGHRWKRDVGIVCIVSALAGATMSVMMAAVFANPEFNKKLRPEHADFFHDYLFAAIWFGTWLLLGGALVLMSRSDAERPGIPRPVAR